MAKTMPKSLKRQKLAAEGAYRGMSVIEVLMLSKKV